MALERAKCVQTPLQSCSKTRGLPGLPPLPQAVKEPSDLYKIVLRNSEHPPIMKGTSWTLAAPFKEQKYHRTPSESIANNYTPSASDLKIKDLPKIPRVKTKIIGELHSPRTREMTFSRNKTFMGKQMNGKAPNGHQANGHYASGHHANGHDMHISPELGDLQEVDDTPPSRPLTPHEQMDIMREIEKEDDQQTGLPSDRDLERYYYYIERGIEASMIAPPHPEMMKKVLSLVPEHLLTNTDLDPMIKNLSEEIAHDHQYSCRKSIVDYILKDGEERARLHISTVPKSFPQRVVRAPVPWHETFLQMKDYNKNHLFITNPIMHRLQNIWCDEFNSLRFINLKDLERADLPLLPSEFESLIRKQCWEAHEVLRKTWIPTCAKIFVDEAEHWQSLVGPNDNDSTELVQEFFSSVAAIMSRQLRGMVINSLQDFLSFFEIHKSGNDYGEEFDDLRYVMPQIMIIKLRVEEPKIVFDPPFREIRDIILRCFSEIIASGEGLQRVECQLFPDMRGQKLLLRSVKIEEALVTDYVDKAMEVFKLNTVGPQKYLSTYKKYLDLLNNKADQDVTAFLRETHSIAAFKTELRWKEYDMELVKMAQKYDPDYVSEDEMNDMPVIQDHQKTRKKKPKIYRIREEEYRRRYGKYNSSTSYSDENSTEEIGFQNLTDDSALGFGNDNFNESETNLGNIENKTSFDIDSESFENKVNAYSKHLHSDNYASKIQLGSSFDIFGKENAVDEISEIDEDPLEEDSGGEQSIDDDTVSYSRPVLSNLRNNGDLSYSRSSLSNLHRKSTIRQHDTIDPGKIHQGDISQKETEVEKSVFDLAKERIINVEKKKNAKLLLRQLQMTTEPKKTKSSNTKESSAGSKNSEKQSEEQSEKNCEKQCEKQTEKQSEIQSEKAKPIEIEEELEERYESLCEDVNPNVVELLL